MRTVDVFVPHFIHRCHMYKKTDFQICSCMKIIDVAVKYIVFIVCKIFYVVGILCCYCCCSSILYI